MYPVTTYKDKSPSRLSPEAGQRSYSPTYSLTHPGHQYLDARNQLPSSGPSSQLAQQIIGSLHSRRPVGWNTGSTIVSNKYAGTLFI